MGPLIAVDGRHAWLLEFRPLHALLLARRWAIESNISVRLLTRRQFQAILASGLVGSAASGCGTILFPERIGQPPGMLDWKVVALDTIGLLLFVVPGVIAFVVDFYNGTIFLPPWQSPYYCPPNQLTSAVPLKKGEITIADIERTVADKLDLQLDLQPGGYVTRELKSMDDYPAVSQQLASAIDRGEISVRCQSPDGRR